MDEKPTKVIVIGAGWSGIAAAVKYIQIKPTVDLLIIDEDSSFGGTWSASRIYSHLVADSPRGTLEYSDMTMVDETHPPWSQITGRDVHDYLEQYVTKHDLHRRTKFDTRVETARRNPGGGWDVSTSEGQTFSCDKLIVAYGQTSVPNIPDLPNDGFTGFTMHSKTLGEDMSRLRDDEIKHVTILGGSKSAAECCIAALETGKKVHWVIRESGSGPPDLVYRDDEDMKRFGKTIFSKLFYQFTPSIYNRQGFWYRILHSGRWSFGRFLINNVLEKIPFPAPDFDANENMRKLKPRYTSFFWETTGLVLLPPDNILFRELLSSNNLTVHRGDPSKLTAGTMHLTTSETIPTDFLIYATGWDRKASTSIFTPSDQLSLGLPTPLSATPPSHLAHLSTLSTLATHEILTLFPYLSTPPPHLPSPPAPHPYTSLHLLRHILSPALFSRRDRSITLVGLGSTVQSALQAELYSLWAVAWMEDLHPPSSPLYRLPSLAALDHEAALETAWNAKRYPFTAPKGEVGFLTEIGTFWDTVMRDLGLEVDRKRRHRRQMKNETWRQQKLEQSWWDWGFRGPRRWLWGWCDEYFSPYMAKDYEECVRELLENHQKRSETGMREGGGLVIEGKKVR